METREARVCPVCLNEYVVERCSDCDSDLLSLDELEVEAEVQACKACGKRIPDGVFVCPACRASMVLFPALPSLGPTAVGALAFMVVGALAYLVGLQPTSILALAGGCGVSAFLFVKRKHFLWKRMMVPWCSLPESQQDALRKLRYALRQRDGT